MQAEHLGDQDGALSEVMMRRATDPEGGPGADAAVRAASAAHPACYATNDAAKLRARRSRRAPHLHASTMPLRLPNVAPLLIEHDLAWLASQPAG
jgi:hypothetical protein